MRIPTSTSSEGAIARCSDSLTVAGFFILRPVLSLQFTSGASYTNNFADLFTVTNTVGTVTNYLDVGTATNKPSRFYRVRLVP